MRQLKAAKRLLTALLTVTFAVGAVFVSEAFLLHF